MGPLEAHYAECPLNLLCYIREDKRNMKFPVTRVKVAKLAQVRDIFKCRVYNGRLPSKLVAGALGTRLWAEYCSLVPDSAAGAQLFIQDFSVNCTCPRLFQGGEDDIHEQCTRHSVQSDQM